jgi:hypothetical protein
MKMKKIVCLVVYTLFTFALTAGVALSAYDKAPEEIKGLVITVIMGTINSSNQLLGIDGQTFNVADNEEGKTLFSYSGQKVLVSGFVMEREGKKLITVLDCKLIPENPDY